MVLRLTPEVNCTRDNSVEIRYPGDCLGQDRLIHPEIKIKKLKFAIPVIAWGKGSRQICESVSRQQFKLFDQWLGIAELSELCCGAV